ncbi:hypothetical protein PUR61_40930 [Streptomyces sp. BE20]|uniref:hypothetical protein n=1 Tax=Streptomyces sp. BE20 TaxID=3002525 RepID=UPI002E7777F2|nr:hypothetical protein [Streptomyces sp. BE20]MEE1828487.1 hypothetical protein [Streptomyces sp. BE20]
MTSHPIVRPWDNPQPEVIRRLCLAADIEQYSRFDTPDQRVVQARLARVLRVAAERSGLDHGRWSSQPQGDMEFAVLPPGTPEPVVLGRYVTHLAAELGGYNATRRPAGRLRLRLAIDTGVAATAALGFSGPAPVAVARYLNAPEVKQALAAAGSASLVVVISDRLYQDVVRSRPHGLDPEQYRRIHVRQNGFAGYGWVQLPGTEPEVVRESWPLAPQDGPRPPERAAEREQSSFVQHGVHGTAVQGVIHGSVYGAAPGGASR